MSDLYHFAHYEMATGDLSQLAGFVYAIFLSVIHIKGAL
jgi:hypothetical protein